MSSKKSKDLEEVVDLLKGLKEDFHLNQIQHQEEHEYLRNLIDEHKARKEFWETVRTRVVGTGIVALLSAIASAVWFTLEHLGDM